MKLNREIFHKFFYAGESENAQGRASVSFYGWTFKSYNTTIGVKACGKDGKPVLLLADRSFSNTTCEHLHTLWSACPYTSDHVIHVPFDWGDVWYARENCIDDLLQRFINTLSNWEVDDMKYVKVRRKFLVTYHNFRRFLELVVPKQPARAILRKIEDLAAVANEMLDRKRRNELISGLTAKREAAAKRKAAAEKRKHAEFLKQFSVVPELPGEDVITTQDVRIEVGEPIG